MEQQFKTDGLGLSNRKAKKTKKGWSNRKAMNEDRISELPDALLLQILSSLPTDNAITTSVLSKRWRSVWKMVPILKFEYLCPKKKKKKLKFESHQVLHNRDFRVFSDNVYRCLTLHKAPVLESLHLKFEGKVDCVDVGIWIATAFARRVRKLVLVRDVYEEEEHIVTLPSVLFTYNDTLEILKLKYSIAIDFPSRVCLKSLRKLCLYQVRFQDEESFSNFLCGCPSLEDLDMYSYRESYTNVATFTIAVPSLQRLTLDDGYYGDGIGGYVINAPSLKYLNINGFHGFEFCLIENAPELLEAEISNVSDITDENILESLTSAKRLSLSSLSPSEIMPPTGKIFYQLLSLELSTKGKESWNLLSLMLSCSPKLQILKLFWFNSLRNSPIDCTWKQPKCVPECLLFHLETFVWTRYDWQREDEKEVATYILKNGRQLKKATLSTKDIEPRDLKKLEKRREMLDELANVVRASSSCHLVLESDTYSND